MIPDDFNDDLIARLAPIFRRCSKEDKTVIVQAMERIIILTQEVNYLSSKEQI